LEDEQGKPHEELHEEEEEEERKKQKMMMMIMIIRRRIYSSFGKSLCTCERCWK
jgi:hypothetical protein